MGASSGSYIHHQASPNMLPPRQLSRPSGIHPSLFPSSSDAQVSTDPHDPRSSSVQVRESPTESASSRETWPTVDSIPLKNLEAEKVEKDFAEHTVTRRFSNSEKFSLRDVARERVDVLSEKLHLLPDEYLEELKDGLRSILDGTGGSHHREEFFILQKLVQSRLDLTANTLIRAHLIEVFLYKRCRNIACQKQLPAEECTCDLCTIRKGFCNLCM